MFLLGCDTFYISTRLNGVKSQKIAFFTGCVYKTVQYRMSLAVILYLGLFNLLYHTQRRVCNIQHFNFQLTHTTLKNVALLKHFKIRKTAPTCFGLQGNHHQ